MPGKRLPLFMWAGFVDGKLYVEDMTGEYGTYQRPGLFLTKKRALVEYQDVRKVRVSLVRSDGGGSHG